MTMSRTTPESFSPHPMAFRPQVWDEAHDALAFLGQRHSVGPKYLTLPAPSPEELQQAVAVALRAPDHQQLRPFRFVRVGDAQRERLGGLFARDAARRGHGAAEVERARERAHNGPALLAVVGHVRPNVEDVPDHEQWVCIGAGMMNFLNALHLMGYGAKILSGASVRDPDIQAAFCRSGETLVAWVLAGTPTRVAHPKHADDAPAALSDWA
jgi:nitroreductase family protein